MTNRPCLDMDKVVELMKGYCQVKGYDENERLLELSLRLS